MEDEKAENHNTMGLCANMPGAGTLRIKSDADDRRSCSQETITISVDGGEKIEVADRYGNIGMPGFMDQKP